MPTESSDAPLIPADEGDVEAMAQLWAEAFPEKPAERRKREIREGMTYGDLSDCWVVRQQGRIAGALRTYRFTTYLWGRAYPTMGLAGVATAPDFRRRGLGRRMCRAALEIAHERGDVLSALFPFRTSFYRDLGYTLVGSLHRYRFHPGELATYPGWDRVVRDPTEGETQARAIYSRVAPATNGLVHRTERMWSFVHEEDTYLYLHRNEHGDSTGYIVVRGEGGPPDRSTLHVVEMVAENREAYLALLGWLSVQRDQWARVVYDAVPGENFMRRLAHPRTHGSGNPRGLWFHSAHLLRGPMLRIIDLERFLSGDSPGSSDPADPADAADAGAVDRQGPATDRNGSTEGVAGPTGGTAPSVGEGRVTSAIRSGEPLTQRFQLRDAQIPDNQGVWDAGRRTETALHPGASPILTIGEATALAVEGRLPGQAQPPAEWTPNLGLTGHRLLDEF
jgi:predicted acetyltransferase